MDCAASGSSERTFTPHAVRCRSPGARSIPLRLDVSVQRSSSSSSAGNCSMPSSVASLTSVSTSRRSSRASLGCAMAPHSSAASSTFLATSGFENRVGNTPARDSHGSLIGTTLSQRSDQCGAVIVFKDTSKSKQITTCLGRAAPAAPRTRGSARRPWLAAAAPRSGCAGRSRSRPPRSRRRSSARFAWRPQTRARR